MEKGWLWDAVVMMFAERVNDCVERTCACDDVARPFTGWRRAVYCAIYGCIAVERLMCSAK